MVGMNKLRIIGFLEGISFLILLFIAMPLKYFYDFPLAVKIIGPIHGILFIAFASSALAAKLERNWPKSKLLLIYFAAIIPFGPFIFDKKIFKSDQ